MQTFPRQPVPLTRRRGALVLAVASMLLLAGCAQSEPKAAPAPSPTVKPLFATDADALAAATKAYAAYLKVSDEVSQNGGVGTDRLSKLVTGSWFKDEKASAATFANSGLHQTGSSTFDRVKLQNYERDARNQAVTMYLCLDLSGVRVLDENGVNTMQPDAADSYAFVAKFVSSAGNLVLDEQKPWEGVNFCL